MIIGNNYIYCLCCSKPDWLHCTHCQRTVGQPVGRSDTTELGDAIAHFNCLGQIRNHRRSFQLNAPTTTVIIQCGDRLNYARSKALPTATSGLRTLQCTNLCRYNIMNTCPIDTYIPWTAAMMMTHSPIHKGQRRVVIILIKRNRCALFIVHGSRTTISPS